MSDWTPGPWRIARHCSTLVESENGRNTASAGGYTDSRLPDGGLSENAANARLIAASPELVEALESTHALLNEAMNRLGREHEGFVGEDCMNRWVDNEELLAKIRGDQ